MRFSLEVVSGCRKSHQSVQVTNLNDFPSSKLERAAGGPPAARSAERRGMSEAGNHARPEGGPPAVRERPNWSAIGRPADIGPPAVNRPLSHSATSWKNMCTRVGRFDNSL